MSEKDSQSLDVLGLKPYGDAIKITVEKSLDGAGAFLSRICLPVAEEIGLFLKDRVHLWRSQNIANALEKAEKKYKEIHGEEKMEAHPKMLSSIVEHVSWTDDDEVQEMWAGLLASSCTADGKDDSNLIFINVLSQLTTIQVKILNYACSNAEKSETEGGWIRANKLNVVVEVLQEISQIADFHRLDREMDHLRSLELLDEGGFYRDIKIANITPTPLALYLFVRCQGSLESPNTYFQNELVQEKDEGSE